MKKHVKTIVLGALTLMGLIGVFWSQFSQTPSEATFPESHVSGEIPVKGMVTMVDLGANQCIPCKMMVPVMEKVEKKYKGKAAIVFIDVWKDKEPAKRFGIRAIPTQIFFDKEGKEVYRHTGFMGEAEIDRIFKKMGLS
ncbi:MAG: thioredoxin fold domain-containing protein [Deltaproteobacteria bacterium]|nr:thioredoxin fold domain-containing protein [Deltaproteobacteria bacterium]